MNDAGRARLLADLGIAESGGEQTSEEQGVRQVLAAFHRRSEEPVSPEIAELASILEEANVLDEAFETESWNPGELEHDPWVSEILGKLRVLPDDAAQYVKQHVPLLPPSAVNAIRMDLDSLSVNDLCRMGETDEVLAAYLLRAANTAPNIPPAPVQTVGQAIEHLGFDTARSIAVAASLRPLFDQANLRKLWNHSLDAAQISEELASISDCSSRPEAFLAGLLHDIGQLVMLQLPANFQARYARLIGEGCPMQEAETVLAGFTHADCGAVILETWDFPSAIVRAVGNHHRLSNPSDKLAALLYLAEFWCAEEEDLPSSIRLHAALSACGLEGNLLLGSELHLNPPVQVLRFGAEADDLRA